MSEHRPYTPAELVKHLGRECKYKDYVQKIISVGLTHVLVAGDQGYTSYENLAEHYTWVDTGEPCGVCADAAGNHTELIERLRTYRGGYDHEHDCHGAANVIEQLEAALRASTELLRTMYVTGGVTVAGIKNQIAANEAALKGATNDTD